MAQISYRQPAALATDASFSSGIHFLLNVSFLNLLRVWHLRMKIGCIIGLSMTFHARTAILKDLPATHLLRRGLVLAVHLGKGIKMNTPHIILAPSSNIL